ncbi:MAG: hypothetical protein P8M02_05645 [Flavobacteriaceae bacterium]|nr:hypothetical protein [Flavobacteriaceae bacterium]
MKKLFLLFLLFLLFIMFSCFKSDIVQYSSANTDPAKDASGLQYNGLDSHHWLVYEGLKI